MFRLRALLAALALLVVAVPSCDNATGPRFYRPAAISLSARFALAMANDSVNLIRTVARDSTDSIIASADTTVDPNAASWSVRLDVPMGTVDERSLIISIELIKRAGASEQVQWAGRSSQTRVLAGQTTTISGLLLGRGPLSNLSITSVSIGEVPSQLTVGDSALLTFATAENTEDVAPVFFWASLDTTIATVDNGGKVRAKATGSARIVVAAGFHADTATINVVEPSGGVGFFFIDNGNDQTAIVDHTVEVAPTVRVLDSHERPIADVGIVWGVLSGDGAIVGSTVSTTDSTGRASVNGWQLGKLAGVNTLGAWLEDTGEPLVFTATGIHDLPATILADSGNGQSGTANIILPQPLVIKLVDKFGNPVPDGVVTFIASNDGILGSPTDTTDASGRARTTWTPGFGSATQTVDAYVGDIPHATFTATVEQPNPGLILTLEGTDKVSLGKSGTLRIRLTTPSTGVVLQLTSSNPGILAFDSQSTVSLEVPGGATEVTGSVQGLAEGTATITATAQGYESATLPLTVEQRIITLPATFRVPFGGTASIPVTLTRAAPAGGTVVSLVSSNPAIVSAPQTVTVPAGATTANATLTGVIPGTVSLVAENPNYDSDTSAVTSAAALVFDPSSVSLNQSFGTTARIRLTSNNVAIAAPASGVEVTLTSQNPACLAVPAKVTIPAGLVDTTVTLAYGGSGQSCGNVQVYATAPNITSDTLTANVAAVPGITLSATSYGVAAGLQKAMSGFLDASNHGGTTVHLEASGVGLLIASRADTVGSSSLDIQVPDGQASFNYYLQALDGQAGDTVDITATATSGFTEGTLRVAIVQPAFEIQGLPSAATTFTQPDDFTVRVGAPYINPTTGDVAFVAEVQTRRWNAEPLTVHVVSSDATVGELITLGTTAGEVSVSIKQNEYQTASSVAAGGVALNLINAGQTTISADIPGFLSVGTRSITVSAPPITMSAPTVGAGLMRATSGFLGASSHNGVTVHLVSADSTRLKLSPNATTAGAAAIDVNVSAGSAGFSYYIHGMEGVVDSATVTASVSGFASGTARMAVVAPALDISGISTTQNTLSGDQLFRVRVGIPNSGASALSEVQPVRTGAPALTATVTSATPTVGQLVTSQGVGGTGTVQIVAGEYQSASAVASGGVAFRPIGGGTTTVSATIPGLIATSTAATTVTITAPAITLSSVTVGAGLQRSISGFLGSSNHGGVTVHLESSNPSMLLLAPNDTTPGTPTLDVVVPNGSTTINYYVQGVEGARGTDTVTATAPGFTATMTTMTVAAAAYDIANLSSSLTTLANNNEFVVRIGLAYSDTSSLSELQRLRPGHPALNVTVRSSNPVVGKLVTSLTTDSVVTIALPARAFQTQNGVASGGVAFDPATSGTSTISAEIDGLIATKNARQTVNVIPPSISVSSGYAVGAGLMRSATVGLGAAAPTGGVTVHLVSSQPSTLLLAANDTAAATASIDIPVAAGSSGFTYYLAGVEGTTGTAVVTASATAFADGTGSMTVLQPALDITGLQATTNAAAPDIPFRVRIGVPSGTSALSELQSVRAHAQPVVVTIVSSSATVGVIKDSSRTGGTLTMQIPPRASQTPTSVATGGVAFDPVGVGQTTVSASIPGYLTITSASAAINVTEPNFTFNATSKTVGAGLQTSVFMSVSSHQAPVTIHLASSDPSKFLISMSPSVAGAAAIDTTIAASVTGFTIYIQALEQQTGSGTITVSAPQFAGASLPVSAVTPSVVFTNYPSSISMSATDYQLSIGVGISTPGSTTLSEQQTVRAGASALTVTVTSSNTTVGVVKNSQTSGGSVTATIAAGSSTTSNLANGGAVFDPLTAGTTTIGATISGFTSIGTATGVQVSVTSP